MNVSSQAGSGSPSNEQEEEALFFHSLPLFLANIDQILNRPELYFCIPAGCYSSFPYSCLSPMSIGHLMEGYLAEVLTDCCPQCRGKLYVYRLGGGGPALTYIYGHCIACKEISRIRPDSRYWERVRYVVALRRAKPIFTTVVIEYQGQEFTWAGSGIRPAIKKRKVTRPIHETLLLTQVVEVLT